MFRKSEYFITRIPMTAHSEYYLDKENQQTNESNKKSRSTRENALLIIWIYDDLNSQHSNKQVNCVIVGDAEVGKTSMIKALTEEALRVPDKYEPTIFDLEGYCFTDKLLETFTFKIYDTAGKSRYDRLRQLTYLDANIVVICYSVDSRQSFWNAEHRWYDEIRFGFCPQGTPFIVAATKTDLRIDPDTKKRLEQERRTIISSKEGKMLADRIEASAYTECTSTDKKTVLEVFYEALKAYCNCHNTAEKADCKKMKGTLKLKLEHYQTACCTVC